jgi:hypothetical protein
MASDSVRFCDEFDGGLGWIADDQVSRTSHALVVGGGVWLIDPVDAPGVEERVRALGEPRGVIQLLDRHERDGPELARRLDVPVHVVPAAVDGAPFELVPLVRRRWWRESALWWSERRVLVVADALGTVLYFRGRRESIGVHPLLRLFPPRALGRFDPLHVLTGHGEGIHGEGAADAVREALRTARRRLLPALGGLFSARNIRTR